MVDVIGIMIEADTVDDGQLIEIRSLELSAELIFKYAHDYQLS